MKVLLINNYPMDQAWRLWKQGDYPGNHLFGMTHIDRHGFQPVIPPYRKYGWLASLGRGSRLGDLDQQVRALFEDCDVIYAASQFDSLALATLRAAGVLRKPLVGTIHGPFRPGLERRIAAGPYARGHDMMVCLGPELERHMREDVGVPARKLECFGWGIDLDFYRRDLVTPPPEGPPRILTAGKAGRDFETLIRAVDGLACRLCVVTAGRYAPARRALPPNVELIVGPWDGFALTYPELLAMYQRATLVAIPLVWSQTPRGQTGNTSLLEAMAMGRPALMTRHDLLAFDVETEGVGLWVDPGDVAGWRRAIQRLLADPQEARRMGGRGRMLCETRYNMDVFAAGLARVLCRVISR